MVFPPCCRRTAKGRGCPVLDIIPVAAVIMVGVMPADTIGTAVIAPDTAIG